MDWFELLSHMRQGNSSTRRFFSELQFEDDLGSLIVAYANTSGGFFFIGVDVKNYHLSGTSIGREWVDLILRTHCKKTINLTLSYVEKNNRLVLVGEVKEGMEKPYYFKDLCYVIEDGQPVVSLLEKVNNRFTTLDSVKNDDDTKDKDINAKEPAPGNSEATTLNHRQLDAISYVDQHGFIKNKTYREQFDVSHKTAHLELVDLVEKGHLESKGAGRSTQYEKK